MTDIRDQARAIARILDSAFTIPGTRFRFGIDPILGLIPGIGDLLGGGFSAYIMVLAARAGAPVPVLARMFLNVAVEMTVGTIPLLGDLFDVGWKANQRNVNLLEEYLDDPRSATISSWTFLVIALLAITGLVVATIWIAAQIIEWLASLF